MTKKTKSLTPFLRKNKSSSYLKTSHSCNPVPARKKDSTSLQKSCKLGCASESESCGHMSIVSATLLHTTPCCMKAVTGNNGPRLCALFKALSLKVSHFSRTEPKPSKPTSGPSRQIESPQSNQKGEGQVPMVKLIQSSGFWLRKSSINWSIASKSSKCSSPPLCPKPPPRPSNLKSPKPSEIRARTTP